MSITKPDGYVYRITNNINGKTYIGSHAGHNPSYMGSGVALKSAYDKYGTENFTKEVVIHCEKFQEVEEQILMVLNAANDPQMYNLINSTTGGSLGLKHSSESRAKMSASQTGRTVSSETRSKISTSQSGPLNHQYGKPRSAEHRARISAARVGTTHSAESRAKMSAAQSGHLNHQYGKTPSAASRARMRTAQLGKLQPKETCPHCAKTGGRGGMSRWHFDNCKHKPN